MYLRAPILACQKPFLNRVPAVNKTRGVWSLYSAGMCQADIPALQRKPALLRTITLYQHCLFSLMPSDFAGALYMGQAALLNWHLYCTRIECISNSCSKRNQVVRVRSITTYVCCARVLHSPTQQYVAHRSHTLPLQPGLLRTTGSVIVVGNWKKCRCARPILQSPRENGRRGCLRPIP